MHNDETQRLSHELVALSGRLVRDVRRSTADTAGAGARMLALLDEHGPSSIGRLAEIDGCTQPTVSGLVKGLVAKGWVERRPHPFDARSTMIELTALGRGVLGDVRARNATLVSQRVSESGHSTAELAAAVGLLRDLAEPSHPGDPSSPSGAGPA